MADVTVQMIKELREMTGAGMMECKGALIEADGDMDKGAEILLKKSAAIAAKKAHRSAAHGQVKSYIHTREDGGVGTLGVMVEVNCETDFAARLPVFAEFVDKLTLHIAAAAPSYVKTDEIPEEEMAKQLEIFKAQMEDQNKPADILEKIAQGKLAKWRSEICLMDQVFALGQTKEEQITIDELLKQTIGKIGENIVINQFARFEIGA